MAAAQAGQANITLLGLGPGGAELLTREAWDFLSSASEVYLRTRKHPAVDGLPPHLALHSFDETYDQSASFEEVYESIVESVLRLAQRPQGVVYAVPGHPFVAEATAPEIARRAKEQGLTVRVLEGLSFLEPAFSLLGIDPYPKAAFVDALELAQLHHPNFPPNFPAVIAQIHSPAVASNLKLTLMAVYPDDHPVKLVHAAGTPAALIEELALYEIDRSEQIGLLTLLYLPPLEESASFEAFQEVIAHLRAPEGCPWDREQTHSSLRPYLLEEAYEVLTALDADDPMALREELGDLLLQIVLHAQIASEYGDFSMREILSGINQKLVRRHPHVFGELDLQDKEGVLQNWERLKAAERKEKGEEKKSLLDSVSKALPALAQAEAYQERAARVGFDWKNIDGVLEKLAEEVDEIRAAQTPEELAWELGDLLFAMVNLARWLKVDPESALRESNQRFRERFGFIEQAAKQQGKDLKAMSLDEMDALWDEAKKK